MITFSRLWDHMKYLKHSLRYCNNIQLATLSELSSVWLCVSVSVPSLLGAAFSDTESGVFVVPLAAAHWRIFILLEERWDFARHLGQFIVGVDTVARGALSQVMQMFRFLHVEDERPVDLQHHPLIKWFPFFQSPPLHQYMQVNTLSRRKSVQESQNIHFKTFLYPSEVWIDVWISDVFRTSLQIWYYFYFSN